MNFMSDSTYLNGTPPDGAFSVGAPPSLCAPTRFATGTQASSGRVENSRASPRHRTMVFWSLSTYFWNRQLCCALRDRGWKLNPALAGRNVQMPRPRNQKCTELIGPSL